MRRTVLQRRRPLQRRSALRSRPRILNPDSARGQWKMPRWGRCQNCGLVDSKPLHGHHVVARQVVARAGGDEWDARNRLDLCERCHANHEFGQKNRKIGRDKIPARAVEFAVDLMGEDVAMLYFLRHYREAS